MERYHRRREVAGESIVPVTARQSRRRFFSVDFFEHQERARRWSSHMVWLFLLVVLVVVVAVNAAVAVAYVWWFPERVDELAAAGAWWRGVETRVYVATTSITLAVIFGGAIYRSVQLAQGGKAVAKMMGARRIKRNTDDVDERRLINVVEEMAIASGMLLPAVYVMDGEQGMNAFAAGYEPHEAVIVVTSGLLRALDRDELQGVVAHEFSHIFNGDMRLNVRMLSMLNGVSILGSLGRHMLRGIKHEPRATLWLLGGGTALLLIGSIGVFAARLLKAAVSRQREFLADASAVQFTRNNSGIGRALLKIHDHATGGVLRHRYAEELSHFFFAEGRALWWDGWLATHPSLLERVRRVAPHLVRKDKQGGLTPRTLTTSELASPSTGRDWSTAPSDGAAVAFVSPSSATSSNAPTKPSPTATLDADVVASSVGNPNATQVTYAADFFLRMPADIKRALREAPGRSALVCCLAVEQEWLEQQRQLVEQEWGPSRAAQVWSLVEPVRALGVAGRLPLLELAVPGLRQLASDEQQALRRLLDCLIAADGRIDMWEWIVATLVEYVLSPPVRREKHLRLDGLQADLSTLLSALAYTDANDDDAARSAFKRGVTVLGWGAVPIPPRSALALDAVRSSLIELAHVTPVLRRQVLRACAAVVLADQKLTPRELELLRAVAVVLDCPIPPGVYSRVALQ